MKYHPDFHPKLVLWMMRCGLSEAEVAGELEITPQEFAMLMVQTPAVRDAVTQGKKYFKELADTSLLKMLRSYTVEETEVIVTKGKDPSVKRTTRHIPANEKAVFFVLENDLAFKMAKKIADKLPQSLDRKQKKQS